MNTSLKFSKYSILFVFFLFITIIAAIFCYCLLN